MQSLHESLGRAGALAAMDLRRLKADPGQCYVLIVLPLVMVLAITPMALAVLRLQGVASATGAEQSVPGMAALFSFMSVILLGASFFKEHEWGTWNRLRASPALPIEIVAGKCLPIFGVSLFQLAAIWCVGLVFYGLRVHGPLVAIAVITICLSWASLGVGMALVSLCRTVDQLGILANMGSLILGGFSGAFVPISPNTLWGNLARFSPLYWSMHAYQQVIFTGSGIAAVAPECLCLIALGVTGFVIAAMKFRAADLRFGAS